MKKLIAMAALASLLALVGCAQGAASSSAEASSASVSSAAMSSQSADVSGVSAGQSQATSVGTPAAFASSVASVESAASPQSGAASAEHADSFVVGVGDVQLVVTLADTDAARALAQRLQAGPVTVSLHAYGGFEKVGPLPWPLPANDEQITTQPGDVMLYQGNQITVFTGSNSWAYTPLGHIEGATSELLLEALGDGDAKAALSLR